MSYFETKDIIIHIIKEKGDCRMISCTMCPFDFTKCESGLENMYKRAVSYYIKKYGREELMELLI